LSRANSGALGERFIDAHTPVVQVSPQNGGRNQQEHKRNQKLIRATSHWITWNLHLSRVSDWTYKLEDIDFPEICSRAKLENTNRPCPTQEIVDRVVQKIQRKNLTNSHLHSLQELGWDELARLDPLLTEIAMSMAALYGYNDVPAGVPQHLLPLNLQSGHF